MGASSCGCTVEDEALPASLDSRQHLDGCQELQVPYWDSCNGFRPRILSTSRLDLSKLDGTWLDLDAAPTCFIKAGVIVWHWDEDQTTMLEQEHGELYILLAGERFSATIKEEPTRLHWSDGAKWVRDDLQGVWHRKLGGARLGQVEGGRMLWDETFEHEPSRLEPASGILPQGQVHLRLLDTIHTARYEPGSPTQLLWADGEVWAISGQLKGGSPTCRGRWRSIISIGDSDFERHGARLAAQDRAAGVLGVLLPCQLEGI
eukprot:s2259_g11.t1